MSPPATAPERVAICQADEFQAIALARSSVGTRFATSDCAAGSDERPGGPEDDEKRENLADGLRRRRR